MEYDTHYDGKKKKIWLASGVKTTFHQTPKGNMKKHQHGVSAWVQASTYDIAERVAKKWLRDVYGAKLDRVSLYSWEAYASAFRGTNTIQIEYP